MKINWISYYLQYNGFGKASAKMVEALQNTGIQVNHMTADDLEKPAWMLAQYGIDMNDINISFWDVYALKRVPGRHWLFTMCEGSKVNQTIIRKIKRSNVERLLVPSEFCLEAFRSSGIKLPIDIIPLGTDPEDFPLVEKVYPNDKPYTFMTLADRGDRKGWMEVYDAFYKTFGGKTTGIQDVRLIIKSLPNSNHIAKKISQAEDLDLRLKFDMSHYDNMADFYSQGDCLVLPSRSEGWGMPHREAAMMGLPVILQKYSGLDDGFTDQWAWTLPAGRMEDIPNSYKSGGSGSWMRASLSDLRGAMDMAYEEPDIMADIGHKAREWLVANQTWMQSAGKLRTLVEEEYIKTHGFRVDSSSERSSSAASRVIHPHDNGFGKANSLQTSGGNHRVVEGERSLDRQNR